jgi:tetratricopeptide (TPR) repeat protein
MKSLSSIWRPLDGITAALATVISLIVYIWSAAPNVTLLDSGEFIVASANFGVPHPTGYPLWTILSWLFQLLPLGNAAWEINLFSGVCGALAVGLCAAMLCNIQRWCFSGTLEGRLAWLPACVSLSFSLMLAFSESMWSQAVIAEVYTLHALLVAIFLLLCFMWVRQPWRDGLILGSFFVLALAFTNHHLTLLLSPMPYLLILLLRRRMFLDWLFAGLLTVLLVFMGFAILSEAHDSSSLAPDDQTLLHTSIRFFYCIALAFGVFVWLRRGRVRWRFIAFLPCAVILGILPYAYMPFASSTNPPMNWGYAREAQGFFFSVNRSQYPGSLSEVSTKSLGRLMGTYLAPQTPPTEEPTIGLYPKPTAAELAKLWIGFFWLQLSKGFTPFAIIGYFASILFVFRLSLEKRVWIYLLHLAFVLVAFVPAIVMSARIDRAGWWLHMPFHTATNLIFALLAGLGIGLILMKLSERRAVYFWLAPAMLILPIFTFRGSEAASSQRDRWFGWMYGYDMLKDLPKGSVVIGGTDAGRFVPTYMILGESLQPPSVKRDPSFDRRDLYIITQNALSEPNYMKYLRDHYTTERPAVRNAFERWLGRENTYPEKRLSLPTQEEIVEALKKNAGEIRKEEKSFNERDTIVFSTALRLLWEKNKDEHDFYIEESFPIEWTYEYATPHGLIYKLNKTKVEISPDDVARDFAYWKTYKKKLLDDPNFLKDYDARRSFSKLRQSLANIYRYRKMDKEAMAAYREAIELWPENLESILALSGYQWDQGDYDAPLRLFEKALDTDPNNFDALRLYSIAQLRQAADTEIRKLTEKLAAQPRSSETLRQLINLHDKIAETNKVKPLVERAFRDFPDDADMMRFLIEHYARVDEVAQSLEPAKRLTELESSNVNNHLLLVRAYFEKKDKEGFYKAAQRAIEVGGQGVRDAFSSEPQFVPWHKDPEFKKLLEPAPIIPNQALPK